MMVPQYYIDMPLELAVQQHSLRQHAVSLHIMTEGKIRMLANATGLRKRGCLLEAIPDDMEKSEAGS